MFKREKIRILTCLLILLKTTSTKSKPLNEYRGRQSPPLPGSSFTRTSLLKSDDNFQDRVLTYSYFKAGLSCISACHTACAQSFCQCSNTFQCLLSGPAGVTSHPLLKTHWVTHCYISPHTAIYPYQLTLNRALLGKKLRLPSVWLQLSPNIQLILPAQQILEYCLTLEEILCVCSQKLKTLQL